MQIKVKVKSKNFHDNLNFYTHSLEVKYKFFSLYKRDFFKYAYFCYKIYAYTF